MLLCAESVIFCTSHFTLLLIYRSCMYSSIFFTGTGKTATFSISILQQIDTSNHECQALILAPTRELAQQVFENAYFACFLLTYVEFFFSFMECVMHLYTGYGIVSCETICAGFTVICCCIGKEVVMLSHIWIGWLPDVGVCVVQDYLAPVCFVVVPLTDLLTFMECLHCNEYSLALYFCGVSWHLVRDCHSVTSQTDILNYLGVSECM